MLAKIRCAVLGLGRMGWSHAVNLANRVVNADLIAVVDSMNERAAEFARQYTIPLFSSNVESVLQNADVDAIVIATPTPTHAPLIRAAIAAHKAIFVEKPVTTSLEEVAILTQLVEASNAYCQVGFMRRFDPGYRTAWEQIRKGAIGKPLYFKAVSRDPYCPPEAYIKESGRIFADMSVHDFDIARFLMQEEIREVTAMGGIVHNEFLRSSGDIDQAFTFVRFASGALGDIEGSRIAGYGYDIRAEIVGTEGTLQIGTLRHHDIKILNHNGRTSDIIPNFVERFADAYYLEMVDFIDHLQRSLPPSVTIEDGYKALAIAEAATQSFDEGHPVQVKV